MSRRLLLRGLVASCVLGATAACSPSPIIDPSKAPTPQPTPTLDDQRQTAAQLELDLASSCQRAAAQPANAGQQAWLTATAELHRQHHIVLAQRDPFGGVQADHSPLEEFPSPSPSSAPAALDQLAGLARQAAEHHQAQLTSVDEPLLAALWNSLAICATFTARFAESEPTAPPITGPAVPSKAELPDHDGAWLKLLGHQQALLFGLESLLGKTAGVAAERDFREQLAVRLSQVTKQVEATRAQLSASGASPTPAAPAYRLPMDGDIAARKAAWMGLERNVGAAWSPVVATAASAQRSGYAEQMTQQWLWLIAQGEALVHWPGWV